MRIHAFCTGTMDVGTEILKELASALEISEAAVRRIDGLGAEVEESVEEAAAAAIWERPVATKYLLLTALSDCR